MVHKCTIEIWKKKAENFVGIIMVSLWCECQGTPCVTRMVAEHTSKHFSLAIWFCYFHYYQPVVSQYPPIYSGRGRGGPNTEMLQTPSIFMSITSTTFTHWHFDKINLYVAIRPPLGGKGQFFFNTIQCSQGMCVSGSVWLKFPQFPFRTNTCIHSS